MSNFTVLIFNSEKEKLAVWQIGTDLGMMDEGADMWLNEKGWSVDPLIKEPHLFINAPIISIVEGYYDMGLRTFEEIYTYQEEELQITDKAIKMIKNSSYYEERVERYLLKYTPLDEKIDDLEDMMDQAKTREESQKIRFSKEYMWLEKNLRYLEERQQPYFLEAIHYNGLDKRRELLEIERETMKEYCARFPKLRDFITRVVEKCGSISFLSHWSDHSENEYVPIIEEWEVKRADITVETFAFLPCNTLLKIMK